MPRTRSKFASISAVHQRSAPLQVKAFRQRLVVALPFFKPGAVGRVLVTGLLLF